MRFELQINELDCYRRTADFLNFNNADVLCLQHEFGKYGAPSGSHLLTLSKELRMPVVTTLHTLLIEPGITQRKVMLELVKRSDRLIGALFSGEYAMESAALFNPSIVPHPDQSTAPPGGLRFILSLRATRKGHISSIEFRAGQISADGQVSVDPTSRFVSVQKIVPDLLYENDSLCIKLRERELDNVHADAVMEELDDYFTIGDL